MSISWYLYSLFFLSFLAWAEDYKLDLNSSKVIPTFQGTVLLLKGEVKRFSVKQPEGIELNKGDRIYSLDRLETSEKSMLKIQMTDQTIIALGPQSVFEIQKYDFEDFTKRKALFHLTRGQLRAFIFHKAKEGDLEFRTKSISMGVRGTEFLVNEHKQTELALLSGRLSLTYLKNQRKFNLEPSQYFWGSEQDQRVTLIPVQELKRLKAEQIKEDEDFRPFLSINVVRDATPASQMEKEESIQFKPEATEEYELQWKKMLDLLNRRLKENHYR